MTIENLELKITSDSAAAVKSIDDLIQALGRLQTALETRRLTNFGKKIGEFNTALQGLEQSTIDRYKDLADALERLAALKGLKIPNNPLGDVGKDAEKSVSAVNKSTNALQKLGKSILRVGFYRLIRGIISGITKAVQEGLGNVYEYSKAFGTATTGMGTGTKRIADALDSLTSASLRMKNQLGSAFGELLVAITPILTRLVELVTWAADKITQLFAVLNGGTGYLKAKDVAAEFATNAKKGAAAAKEWKNQLMGFDELNVLSEPTKSGGGSSASGVNFADMFTNSDFSPGIKRFKETFDEFKKVLAGDESWADFGRNTFKRIKESLDSVDWKQVWTNVGKGLGDIGSFLYGLIEDPLTAIKNYFKERIDKWKNSGDGSPEWVGLAIAFGILEGIVDGIIDIGKWIWEKVAVPIIDGFKEAFDIHSPSKVMAEIGGYVIEGFWEGIEEKWDDLIGKLSEKWEELKQWWSGLSLDSFNIKLPHIEVTWDAADSAITRFFGISSIPKLNVKWYANGGFPDMGELFIARENGAEMVGAMNGHTAVANNQQIVEGIRQGVYEAVKAAMPQNQSGGEYRFYLDGKELTARVTQLQRQSARAMG